MQIRCDSCDAPIPAADVDLSTKLAKCRACDSIFSIEGSVSAKAAKRVRVRPPMPASLRVERGEPSVFRDTGFAYRTAASKGPSLPELVLRRRWFRPQHLFMLFFCIAWDGFLVGWYAIGFGAGGELGFGSVLMLVFPVGHVAVGVGLTYWTLAGLLNKTTLRIADGVLSTAHGPIPWKGQGSFAVAEIRRVTSRHGTVAGQNDSSASFEVHVVTTDHVSKKLLTGLPTEDEARYIAWVIEDHLDLETTDL